MINIVALDAHTLNPGDLSWLPIQQLSALQVYEKSSPEEAINRAQQADILIVNKFILDKTFLSKLSRLKCICVSATGFNNVDIDFCKEKNIAVTNVAGYGTSAVAQHVFALLFALTNKVETYSKEVHEGMWSNQTYFSYWNHPILEIKDKTMGIYGFGKIGQEVGKIALAFGMKVIAHHKHPERDKMEGVQMVTVDELFRQSDILTLHAPLTSGNKGIISQQNIYKMKKSSYLINTGRGGLVNEKDLKEALINNIIAGAALDVLSSEPPPLDHILFNVKNCIITPHQAWGSQDARQRLMNELVKNIKAYLDGKERNRIV